ncbi:Uncharacterised protein [Enterobacter ludwigii]|nr:Uncharacterised protein [Enterobacter ludwigii]
MHAALSRWERASRLVSHPNAINLFIVTPLPNLS